MKIIDVKSLAIEDIKVLRYQKFSDDRGYFAETFRQTDIEENENCDFLHGVKFNQFNESYSKGNTLRGLHFQWNPYMAKLVRCISGRLIDLALDIRHDSSTYGKVIAYELNNTTEIGEWIWLPVGFAHGIYLAEDSIIEYICTGMWNPKGELAISPYSTDIDWSLNSLALQNLLTNILKSNVNISEKDRSGISLAEWATYRESSLFKYGE